MQNALKESPPPHQVLPLKQESPNGRTQGSCKMQGKPRDAFALKAGRQPHKAKDIETG